MTEQKFRKLEVWRKSIDLIEGVYKLTERFPKTEIYGLTNQIHRAVISIALNIAEGSGAESTAEFSRFLNIALRSAYEVMCVIEVARRLNYFDDKEKNYILARCDEIAAMITGLTKKLKADS